MTASSPFRRFLDSTALDYDKWHDGIGYDLAVLDELGPGERDQVLHLMLSRTIEWREIEVLEKLDRPTGWKAIQETFERSGSIDPRLAAAAALERAGKLAEPLDAVVAREILQLHAIEEGLTRALLLAEQYPTERVKRALLKASGRPSEAAMHCGALLCYLCGKAKEAFDWDLRPLFLRLAPGNAASDRAAAYRELCARVEMTPEP